MLGILPLILSSRAKSVTRNRPLKMRTPFSVPPLLCESYSGISTGTTACSMAPMIPFLNAMSGGSLSTLMKMRWFWRPMSLMPSTASCTGSSSQTPFFLRLHARSALVSRSFMRSTVMHCFSPLRRTKQ